MYSIIWNGIKLYAGDVIGKIFQYKSKKGILLSYIVFIVMIMGMYFYAVNQLDENMIAEFEILLTLADKMPDIPTIITLVVFMLIYFFINIIFLVSEIYFSVALSNVKPFQQMGAFSTIGIFIVTPPVP